MPSRNVEVVRRFKEAINARDSEVWASIVAADFEFRSVFLGVEGRVYRGPEGGAIYLTDLYEAFDRVHIEIVEQRDLEDGRVFTDMRVHTRGRASGAETVTPLVSIARIQDGKLATYESYTDLDEGRAVARPSARRPPTSTTTASSRTSSSAGWPTPRSGSPPPCRRDRP